MPVFPGCHGTLSRVNYGAVEGTRTPEYLLDREVQLPLCYYRVKIVRLSELPDRLRGGINTVCPPGLPIAYGHLGDLNPFTWLLGWKSNPLMLTL